MIHACMCTVHVTCLLTTTMLASRSKELPAIPVANEGNVRGSPLAYLGMCQNTWWHSGHGIWQKRAGNKTHCSAMSLSNSQLCLLGSLVNILGILQAVATHYWDPKTMRALRIYMILHTCM